MNWLREFFKSPYTRLLERMYEDSQEELAQTKADNRGLVNSLLATVGLPPMTEREKVATPAVARRRSLHQIQASTERSSVQQMRTREALLKAAGKAPVPPVA